MPASVDATDKFGILEDYTESEVYNSSEEEKELVSSLKTRWDKSYQNRSLWDRSWERNLLYLKGIQLLIRNVSTNEVFRLPQDDQHRLLAVNNVLRPTARSLLGKLTRQVPTCIVIPPTADMVDMQGARTADSLLYYIRRKEKLDNVYIDWYRDIITFGTSIVRVWWDKTAGPKVDACPNQECGYTEPHNGEEEKQCPRCAEEISVQMQEMEMEMEREQQAALAMGMEPVVQEMELEMSAPPMLEMTTLGDVRVELIDPRNFYFDPSATNISEAQWCCYMVALPVNSVRRRFPDKAKYIFAETGLHTGQNVDVGQSVVSTRPDFRELDDHMYLYEFHELPTEEHPNGRIIWMGNEMILEEVDNPYNSLNRLPFFIGYWEKNKGEFLGESFIDQAWPAQRELNILLTQLREHRELTNRPKLFVPYNAQVNVDEIDTTPGQIITYNGMSQKPNYGEIPPFPTYVYNEIERMKGDIRTHASVTEQETGAVNSDVSGRYAAIIESEASQQVGPILRYNQPEWIEAHRAVLLLCQEFYTDDRQWTITGQDGPKTYAFNKLNLAPGWDIDIQEDDSMSANHAIRLQQSMALLGQGVFMDQNTGQPNIKAFARAAKLKLPHIGPDMASSQHVFAESIPLMIEAGEEYQPQPEDDADVFSEELHAWLISAGRNHESKMVVDKVRQLWMYYAKNTRAAKQQQQQQAMEQQQQKGGGGAMPSPANVNPDQSGVMQDSQQMTQNADQQAEGAAQAGMPHEG